MGIDTRRPWGRMADYVGAMRRLWTSDVSSYKGEFVSFEDVLSYPKPRQPNGPPALIGSVSASESLMPRADRFRLSFLAVLPKTSRAEQIETIKAAAEHGRRDHCDYRALVSNANPIMLSHPEHRPTAKPFGQDGQLNQRRRHLNVLKTTV
jgi:alkanesulfonate monooxygenase SsuD/methylene tetrahydromethanopterin reductase-like flavin-dependent oxidoreductase (luciferase family)